MSFMECLIPKVPYKARLFDN